MAGIPTDTAQQPMAQQMGQTNAYPEANAVPATIEPVNRVENMPAQQPPAYHEATTDKSQMPYNHSQPMPAQNQMGQGHMVTPLERLGEEAAWVDCPYCKRITQTRVGQEHSTMTVLSGFLLGCLCICLACLPCIMHSCADVDQYCSNCNKKLTHMPYDKPIRVVAVRENELQVSKYPASQQVPSEQPGQVYK